MKILIVSDSHDNWQNLSAAVAVGNKRECDVMLHAGDFVTPGGIKLLDAFKGSVHFVWGNNEGEQMYFTLNVMERENMTHHNFTMEEKIGDLRFFMHHYPIQAQNAAESGKYDVCVYGHDHLYLDETLENGVRLLNSGEIAGSKTGVATCMIFDTETKRAEKIIVAKDQYML